MASEIKLFLKLLNFSIHHRLYHVSVWPRYNGQLVPLIIRDDEIVSGQQNRTMFSMTCKLLTEQVKTIQNLNVNNNFIKRRVCQALFTFCVK